jgi:uncharacterized protein Smg (DUF494 family)
MDRKAFKKQLLKQGFTESEIDNYFKEKDLKEKKKKEQKKQQKKKSKPIIFYGYNTVSK